MTDAVQQGSAEAGTDSAVKIVLQKTSAAERVLRVVVPIAMVAHVRSHYCDDDESSRALLLASIEYPEALNDYRAFVADQLDRLGGMNSACPGEGSMLFFAILGVIMGRTLGFHQLDLDELKPMFDALERIARKSDA